MKGSPDVVVIGAGAAGCGVAWRLAERGADVMVVERAAPGAGATHAAAGMLTPEAEGAAHPALLALGRTALDRWPVFADQLRAASGVDPGFTPTGRIHVTPRSTADTPRQVDASDRVRSLSAAELHALEPALAADAGSASLFPHDASADPRALIAALAEAARRAGVRIVQDEAVAVDCKRGALRSVALRERGNIVTSSVVIAAGAWACNLSGLPATPSIRPVRGDMLAVECDEALLRHIIWAEDCYLVPRPHGRVLIGATMDEVGFAPGPSMRGIAALAAAAACVCPALATARVAETWAGYRPASSDGLPVLGGDPRAPGVFHAGGLFRNGILLAPVVADEIALQVLGHQGAAAMAAFAPERRLSE